MFHWYGLIVGIGVVSAWSVTEHLEPKVNKALPWILVFGLLGARLYHVIDLWSYYAQHLGEIVAIWNGGLGIFGGLLGGLVGLWLYKTDRWAIGGAVVGGLPLAQAIGRWGNLINDELWGVGHQPLFLYESLFDLCLFGYLWRSRRLPPQQRVGIYLLGYGLIRLILEPLKPSPWWVGYIMIGVLIVSGFVLLRRDGRYRIDGL